MVDVEGGNNMLYLPLDRLTQRPLPEVDLDAGRVIIEPVPGLFDEPKAKSK